jgi:hypothetical protein
MRTLYRRGVWLMNGKKETAMRVSRLVLVGSLLLTGACFQGQRLIKLNVDGSGTIVDTVKLSEQAKGMMAGMEQADKSTPAEKKTKKEAKLKERATKMGEGVTFVSLDTAADGTEKMTYTFKDINKVKVTNAPPPSESDSDSKEDPFSFRFSKNGASSVLTVVSPKPKPSDKPAEKKPEKPEEMAQQIAMMKAMMAGLKMTMAVEVNGKLVKTSSPHAAGSTVTIMEVDFDQLDEAGLKKLAAAGDNPDPSLFKGIKGVKFSGQETTIEFSK